MRALVIFSVVDILLLIAGLAVYLYIVGGQLSRIADLLEECYELAGGIIGDASVIAPGVAKINRTGKVIAGALPLLYGMAEGIVKGATYEPEPEDAERPPNLPAMGRRRSRLHEGVGYEPPAVAHTTSRRRLQATRAADS